MEHVRKTWQWSVQTGKLSLLLLLAALMIFSMALGYLPSWYRQSSVGVRGEVELMRKSVSSCGGVMDGRSKVSGGYMPLDGPSAGLSLLMM